MGILKAFSQVFVEKPEDKYKRGYTSAILAIEFDSSEENIMRQFRVAESDVDQDAFNEGWLRACRDKMQALYNKPI